MFSDGESASMERAQPTAEVGPDLSALPAEKRDIVRALISDVEVSIAAFDRVQTIQTIREIGNEAVYTEAA